MARSLPPSGPIGFAWEPQGTRQPELLSAATGYRLHPGLSGRIQHSGWVFDYSFTAGFRVRVGSRSRPWRDRPANVGHLYPPGQSYWEDSRPSRGREQSAWVIFLNGETAGLEKRVEPWGYARFMDEENVIGDLLSETARVGHVLGREGNWKAHSLLFALIHALLVAEHVEGETYRIGAGGGPALVSEWVQSVRSFLRENLSRPIKLTDVARRTHVSLSTLSHQYIKETGETPMQTLGRMRLGVVKSLLLKGEPLKRIARQTGYCDVYHLSKSFKRSEGMSPRAYLKSYAREKEATSEGG
jgi:AraC-like DNA-binding protein